MTIPRTPTADVGPAPILVVDDDRMVRTLVRMALEGSGYPIIEADGGEQALDLIDEQAPPLAILLDHHMPGMEGYVVLGELKKRLPKVPVIMMTADNSQKLSIQCFRQGADDFIAKPFDPDLLPIIVSRAVEKAGLEKQLKEKTSAHLIAQKSSEIKSLFLKNIQKEIVGPISGMQQKIREFLHADENDKKATETICLEVEEQSENLMRMLQDILDLAALETHDVEAKMSDVVVVDILKTAADNLKTMADKKDISFVFDISVPADMRVSCDIHWTRKALEAVIRNALAHSDNYSGVILKAEQDDECFVFSVINAGDPISKHDIDRIFEPFQKGRSTHPSPSGTGIGLSIAKRAMEIQGGRLSAENIVEAHQVAFHLALCGE